MTFCNNNNLFSNLPCPDWMQSPSKFLKGAPPKGRTLFNHVVISYANLLDQKKVLNAKCSSPTGMVRYTKMAIVSLF